MPFVEIPHERLPHLPMFGYDKIDEDDDFAWYTGPHGRIRIEKSRPIVWLDDVEDAIQLGAIYVIVRRPD